MAGSRNGDCVSAARTSSPPRYGTTELSELAAQNNRIMRDLVKELRVKYKTASIMLIVTLAKQIILSAKNKNALPLYACTWAPEHDRLKTTNAV